MIDVGRALRPGTPFLLGLFVIAGLSGVPSYGWSPLLPPAVAIAAYVPGWVRNMPRRGRPERAYAAVFVFAELMLALAIVLERGPRSSALVVMAMPVLFIAVLFPRRGVLAGIALAVALMLGVAFGVDLREVSAIPAVTYCPVFVLISLAVTAVVVRDLDDASRRSAFVDQLTGALNRSALAPRLAEVTHQAAMTGEPVAAIVGDIDRFKAVNDEHGHVMGDAVLRAVARRMSDCVGAFESVYRLGGEEFLILLPGHDAGAAHAIAVRMWQAVRDRPVDGVGVTMSFGVASSVSGQPFDFDALFTHADRALYAAKQAGRDRVSEMHTPDPTASAVQSVEERRATPHPRPTEALHPDVESVGWTERAMASASHHRPVTEELEREHILDLNRRLAALFRVIAVGAFLAIAFAIPWFGWHPLIAPVAGAVPYYLLSRYAHRFRRPGRALATGWALFQTSIAVGFASAHGAPLFALPLLILMVPGRCAVLRARPAAAGAAYTALLMTAVAFDLNAAQILSEPQTLLLPLALLVEAAYLGSIVGRSAVGLRGAGIVDELTGLLNRTALTARLLELDAQSATVAHQVGIVLADVDHFKEINDRSGHAAGDTVLREAGARIRGCLRTFESAYRIGGEEILILLPDAGIDTATQVAQRLCQAFRAQECGGMPVTVSAGVAVSAPGERFVYRDVFQRADAALYEAKQTGRDRVCVDATVSTAPELAA